MKKLLIYILILCFLGLSGCTNNNVNNEGQKELQAEFETVLDEVFIETISDDFLDLYQTIEKLFLSISNNIYNGPETYFDSNYPKLPLLP